MKVFNTVKDIKSYLQNKKEIGFVPTMGALHAGHLSLIKKSVQENKTTVVSIFVNPTQFLPGEDLDKYPKKTEADLKICEIAGVDAVFLPKKENIYFDIKNEIQLKAPKIKGYILEGYNRPGHFDGVLQIVLKLFNIIKPSKAYFGKKDAQQLYLIKKMVKELFLDIDIIPCEIIRDADGLALSSRNEYLTPPQRLKALNLSKSLKRAAKLINEGKRNAEEIKNLCLELLKKQDIEVEYFEIVDYEFNLLKKIEIGNTIILVAAKIANTRLIDNIWL